MSKLQTKFAALTLLISTLTVALFGVFYCSPIIMDMNSHSAMQTDSHCAGAVEHEACPMDIAEHLSSWSQLLAAVVGSTDVTFLVVALFVCLALSRVLTVSTTLYTHRWHLITHQRHRLYNYFIRLFALGIVQPKIFA